MKNIDSRGHVTGKSIFLDDIALVQGTLHAVVFASPIARGTLISLNLTEAMAVSGLVQIFTAADIPGENQIGNIIPDEPLLADREIHFVGQPIVVLVAETLAAARQAKKLIKDDKVVGILGCYYSSVSKTVSAVCERYGVPMINGSSTSPALTKRGFKWFWRTTPHDKQFTEDIFKFLTGLTQGKVRGVKAVPKKDLLPVVSACEKTEWGSHVSGLIKTFAGKYQFKLNKSILYTAKSPDLSSEVQSLTAAKPGTMLFASYISDAILMVKTLKSMKASPKVIWGQDAGFEKPEFRKTLKDDIIGILTRTVFIPSIAKVKKVAGQVNVLYKKKTGNDLGGASARAFTGLQAWINVLEKAGSTKPAAIQKAANTITIPGDSLVVPWKGIKFSTSGDELGQNVLGSGMIGQYQKDKSGNIILQVVYPFELATANMIYPFKGF